MFIAYAKPNDHWDYRFSIESEHPATTLIKRYPWAEPTHEITRVITIGEKADYTVSSKHPVWFKIPDEPEFTIGITFEEGNYDEMTVHVNPSVDEWEDHTVATINELNYNTEHDYGHIEDYEPLYDISEIDDDEDYKHDVENFNLDDFSVKKEQYHTGNDDLTPTLYTFTRHIQPVLK
jgi:hypothetical protein